MTRAASARLPEGHPAPEGKRSSQMFIRHRAEQLERRAQESPHVLQPWVMRVRSGLAPSCAAATTPPRGRRLIHAGGRPRGRGRLPASVCSFTPLLPSRLFILFYLTLNSIYLSIGLHRVFLVAACGIFSCGEWDL